MPIERVVIRRLGCLVQFHSYSQRNSHTPLPHYAPLLATLPHYVNTFQQNLLKSYSQRVHRCEYLAQLRQILENIGRDATIEPEHPLGTKANTRFEGCLSLAEA